MTFFILFNNLKRLLRAGTLKGLEIVWKVIYFPLMSCWNIFPLLVSERPNHRIKSYITVIWFTFHRFKWYSAKPKPQKMLRNCLENVSVFPRRLVNSSLGGGTWGRWCMESLRAAMRLSTVESRAAPPFPLDLPFRPSREDFIARPLSLLSLPTPASPFSVKHHIFPLYHHTLSVPIHPCLLPISPFNTSLTITFHSSPLLLSRQIFSSFSYCFPSFKDPILIIFFINAVIYSYNSFRFFNSCSIPDNTPCFFLPC